MRHCDTCSATRPRFASKRHTVCLKCERDTLRTCKTCGKDKPLTDYAINTNGYIGNRLPTCKQCKAAAKREGIRLGTACHGCGKHIKDGTVGARAYCQDCKEAPRPPKPGGASGYGKGG
jgi:hypothetical protein